MSAWVELDCRIPAPLYAALEDLLERSGALAVTSSDGDVPSYAEPGVARDDWRTFTVQALFDASADLPAIIVAVREAVGDGVALGFKPVADANWSEVWKERWQPLLFGGGHLCVCPTWCTPPGGATHVIRLDPGQAFGTGTHETTTLCLAWLVDQSDFAGKRIVDYGCGSGILALAAARLGASQVLAVDIDDDAVAVARENVRLNGLQARVRVGRPELIADVEADVVIANILLGPLLSLAERLAALLPAGGQVVLAGILADQVAGVLDVYGQRFTMAASRQTGDWVLLTGRRR